MAPSVVRLTHPARWGAKSLATLRQAARAAGFEDPEFVPEPVAAALHFASERLDVGEYVAVYDLGGGTFDTAVLRRTADSFAVVGAPGGNEDLGGEDFDDRLYRDLGRQLDAEQWTQLRESRERSWSQANRLLLHEARRAKEILSKSPDYELYVPPPVDRDLHVTADELNGLIASDLEGTVSELERTIRGAGLAPGDLAAIYLAGGSSRIPLVARLIQQRLGQLPDYLDDPKSVIVLGAARIPTTETAPTTVTRGEVPRQPAAPAPVQRTEFAPAERTELAPVDRTQIAPVEHTEAAPLAPLAPAAAAGAAGAAFPPPASPGAPKPAGDGASKRGGPPIAVFIVGAILLAAIVVGAVIALSGGSPKKRQANVAAAHHTVAGTSTTASLAPGPNVVAEGDANNLLSQFDAIWDSGGTTVNGFAPILSDGVTYNFAAANPANAVTLSGFANVASHFKADLKHAGSGSDSFLFNNPMFSEDAGFTIATGTWTSGTLLGSGGTYNVRFVGPNPQDTGTCTTSPCISAITLVPKAGSG